MVPFDVCIGLGFAAVMMVFVVALCAGFKRKNKAFSLEPVRLIFKQENVQYSEPTVVVRSSDGHIDNSSRNSQLRPHSPTWRNSSLSRELPAIPDVPENTINRNLTRYESASNLYACLDDVRVREAIDPQSSDSSRETSFPVPISQNRVHPYDRIGGPSTSSVMNPSQAASTSVVPHNHNHAQILQQMDNETTMADYRGEARSDMSYTSITVRAPLANLRTRRTSEDGYANVPGENHLYAQVGGEYGGSFGSEQLGSHIYNELYAEVDAQTSASANHGTSSLIDPYATSAVMHTSNSSGPSDPEYVNLPSTSGSPPNSAGLPPQQDDIDKLYAKINKPSRASQKKETQPSSAQGSSSVPGLRSDLRRGRILMSSTRPDDPGASTSRGEVRLSSVNGTTTTVAPVPRSSATMNGNLSTVPSGEGNVVDDRRNWVVSNRSLSDIKASVDAAITSMDSSLSNFLENGRRSSGSGSNGYRRREHVYEQIGGV